MLPIELLDLLRDEPFQRISFDKVAESLRILGIDESSEFAEFFTKFRGPIGSDVISFELLDLYEEDPNILGSTIYARGEFDLPDNYILITNLLAGGALAYNSSDGGIYEIDFEEGLDMIANNEIPSKWGSFVEFLTYFFELD